MPYEVPYQALDAARAHALKEFPKEACGLVVNGAYLPCVNQAVEPEKDFLISGIVWKQLAEKGLEVEAVIHSHPNGPLFPTDTDMQGQIQTAVPWVILATDGERVAPPIVWDAFAAPGPVLGREFVHGIMDCYEMFRDVFRLGREGLEAQGVMGWPLPPIELPPVPRRDGWWESSTGPDGETIPPQNLYVDYLSKTGFRKIAPSEIVAGDCFLMSIRSKVPNHAGVYLGDNLIMHHLPSRASRREPIGIWLRAVEGWYRHEKLDEILAAEHNDKSLLTSQDQAEPDAQGDPSRAA